MRKPKKRKRTDKLFGEWLEFGAVFKVSNVTRPKPARHMIVALDPESGEDYPLYAEDMPRVDEMRADLSRTGQKFVELVDI